MVELLKSNDLVLISFAETLLKAADISYFLADTHMSLLEAQVGIMPRRLLVPREDFVRARVLLRENNLGAELSTDPGAYD
jgi:hypothetical protein